MPHRLPKKARHTVGTSPTSHRTIMKKILSIAFALLLGAVSFTACSKDNDKDDNGSHSGNGTENGKGYIDLGLSVKWATCNVGAEKPEEYGDYYAWGETEVKTLYAWSSYKYCEGTEKSLTKYNTQSEYGMVDNKTTLDLADDVVHVKWGGKWRMPTDSEMEELYTLCHWKSTSKNNVSGYTVTGPNGNSIFLPAAGHLWYDTPFHVGENVAYWSSTLNSDKPDYAEGVCHFYGYPAGLSESREVGLSVRPVIAK